MTEPILLALNAPLPSPLGETIGVAAQVAGGAMNLPDQLISVFLPGVTRSEIAAFEGPARFRLYRGKSLIIISLDFALSASVTCHNCICAPVVDLVNDSSEF